MLCFRPLHTVLYIHVCVLQNQAGLVSQIIRRNLPGYHLPSSSSSVAADAAAHSEALLAFSMSHTAGLWIMTAAGMAAAAAVVATEARKGRRRRRKGSSRDGGSAVAMRELEYHQHPSGEDLFGHEKYAWQQEDMLL